MGAQLADYDRRLRLATGRGILGVACHSYGVAEEKIRKRAEQQSCYVIPVTAGQGVISGFSKTVCAILGFIGCNSVVADSSDTGGIFQAFEAGADIMFMADDFTFAGFNLRRGTVVDNSKATGGVFGGALDLMAGGLNGNDALVLGCGPVGEAACRKLLWYGATLAVYDTSPDAAAALADKLDGKVHVEPDLATALSRHRYILDATPAGEFIGEEYITKATFVAAPGVPLGVSPQAETLLGKRLVHDKLELGVAAMAVALLR
ncbi:pyrrolysine biosynthesis protein PylD [Desulforhopalus singaporensis]|uniref:Pyrrolysine biosynthesis protein PylD n=1 Tax=Desulforhopalus singaporensis TaxID=91360 RepID=A0A1H0KHX4_9BACT|nr:pyrrolysine biosynthesis protein PylD [Desulforhopalus singaporensis]